MNNETHEDRVKILKGAPKDGSATHVTDDGYYIKYHDGKVRYKTITGSWCLYSRLEIPSRSLSDIQQLVDMQNEIDALKIEKSKLSHRIYEHNCRIIGAPRE